MSLRANGPEDGIEKKITRLIEEAKLADYITAKDLTAVKVHFGETGNHTFIPPWFIRPIVDKIKFKGGKPFLTDTNTLYLGQRKNSVDHLITGIMHGFDYSVIGAPLIIADGLKGLNFENVPINKKHFKTVKIARDIYDADSMVVVSHFKGHVMAGFGGAIKNLAMGCAPPQGKVEQHGAHPAADAEKCSGCGTCITLCPQDTIEIIDGKAVVHPEKCIGCGECIANCPTKAMELDWTAEIPPFTERLTEYALGAIVNKKDKVFFINFVMNVTGDCDCMAYSDTPIINDIGILASTDPVALDKACLDLVNQAIGNQYSVLKKNFSPGEDKFKGVHDYTKGEIQLNYGEAIGLGSRSYILKEIQ